ncbi:MAG TPA: mechanosensitive ion channel [Opitutaceae bacterium]|nr:mechanosensitive ion channel [Opitutaceae bacterium]
MSCSSSLLPRVTCYLVVGWVWFAISCWGQQRDDQRIAELKDEIQAMEGVVQGTRNASEKSRLEAKLERQREELRILEDRQAIETRQKALGQKTYLSPLDALREELRTIDLTVEEGEKRIAELTTRRKTVSQARETLTSQLAALKAKPDFDQAKEIELSEQIYTRNEELRALALQREVAELETDLAREGERLRERVKTIERSEKPTLRALLESYNYLTNARNAGDRLGPLFANVEQNLQIGQSALALGQQKLAKFDEELALLDKQTNFFSSNPKVTRLVAVQRLQKKTIAERLVFASAQVEALKQSQEALEIHRRLITLDLAVAEEQFSATKGAYLGRLRWPGLVLLGFLGLYFSISLFALPFLYKDEALFLARRLTRYLLIVLAVGAAASFLFDDLSMVAATMGIISAALVISLQDVCTSAFGWIVIMVGAKFGIGDRLQVDDTRGDVIDIQLLRTTLLEVNGWLGCDEPTGRVILVPNNFIFTTKIFNFSHGHPYIWGKIEVTVSFESAQVAQVLFHRVLAEETAAEFVAARTAAMKMRKRYGVADATYEPRVTSAITGNDVIFSLYYVSHFRTAATTRNRIDHRLIDELRKDPRIQLAVPSLQVAHSNLPPSAGSSA